MFKSSAPVNNIDRFMHFVSLTAHGHGGSAVQTKETCQIVVIIRIGGCVAPWGEQVLSVRVDGQVSFHLRSDGQHRVAKNTRLRFRVGLPAVIRLRAAVITRTALCRRKMSFIQTDNVTP